MKDSHSRIETVARVAFFAMLALFIILCGLLFHQYRLLREDMVMNGHMHLFGLHHNVAPLSDPSLIQSWMTYDYIGHVYRLPPDYLKTTLNITDPRYPHVTIIESSGAQHEDSAVLTAQVKKAVGNYHVTSGT